MRKILRRMSIVLECAVGNFDPSVVRMRHNVPFYLLSFAFNSQRKKWVSTFDIGVVRVSHKVPFCV